MEGDPDRAATGVSILRLSSCFPKFFSTYSLITTKIYVFFLLPLGGGLSTVFYCYKS